MKLHFALTSSLLLLVALFFSSCTYTPPTETTSSAGYLADYRATGAEYWDGDGVSGSPLIKINLDKQQAYFYKGDQLVGQTYIGSFIISLWSD